MKLVIARFLGYGVDMFLDCFCELSLVGLSPGHVLLMDEKESDNCCIQKSHDHI